MREFKEEKKTMYVKTVTYMDFNETERTEDFYFNLTEMECMELEIGVEGGMIETMEKLMGSVQPKEIMDIFKNIVLTAYGVKSADGRRFIKTPEVKEEFAQTPAYSIIFMELMQDAKAASEFMRGIVPNDRKQAISIPGATE